MFANRAVAKNHFTAESNFYNEILKPDSATLGIQPKLKIDSSTDKYEQEADSVAAKVMNVSAGVVQRKCSKCEEEEDKIQRKENGSTANVVSHSISNKIQSSKGGGNQMDRGTLNFMESRFGANFGNVRIHTDTRASHVSNEINARAFTLGNDIYFNKGEYNPQSNAGKKLLAHELTHTIQQRGIGPQIQKQDNEEEAEGRPFFGMEAHNNAYQGIRLMYTVGEMPSAPAGVRHVFNVGPYLIALNEAFTEDRSRKIAYYIAFRRGDAIIGGDHGWNEYIIGPDSIEYFLANMGGYEAAGAIGYFGGPPAPFQAASARSLLSTLEGDLSGAASSFLESWTLAVQDPTFWAQTAVGVAGMGGRAGTVRPTAPKAPPRLTVINGGGPRVTPPARPIAPAPRTMSASGGGGGPRASAARAAPARELAPAPITQPAPLAPPLREVPALPASPGPMVPSITGGYPLTAMAGASATSLVRPESEETQWSVSQTEAETETQREGDEDRRRDCFREHPHALQCDDEDRGSSDISDVEAVARGWIYFLGDANDELLDCDRVGRFPAGAIDDCFGADGVRYHCGIRNRTIQPHYFELSIFGCLCCDENGQTKYNYPNAHESENLSRR